MKATSFIIPMNINRSLIIGCIIIGIFISTMLFFTTKKWTSEISEKSVNPSEITFFHSLTWIGYVEEISINNFIHELSLLHKPQKYALLNVNIVDLKNERIIEGQTILIDNGRILSISPVVPLQIPVDFKIISGNSRYVIPGLIDSHVHTAGSNDQKLLNLLNSVTTVRDMAGQPWMLILKEQINQNKLLAPDLFVASKMINTYSLGQYTTVVNNPNEAKQAVKDHIATGYDYIKIWNNLNAEVFDAVAFETKINGYDLVGHIPSDVAIEKALPEMRTVEHFKQFISNGTGDITNEDYVTLSKNYNGYFCPTFTTRRIAWRDEKALAFFEGPEASFVSRNTLLKWKAESADKAYDKSAEMFNKVFKNSCIIFENLRNSNNFIAGTDSGGGYMFMVPGFSLLDEIMIFHKLGYNEYEALKTATINAAKAMRIDSIIGDISVGKQANLILLNNNPIENLAELSSTKELLIRGIYLDSINLENIAIKLKEIRRYPEYFKHYRPQEVITTFLDSLHAHKRQYLLKPNFKAKILENLNSIPSEHQKEVIELIKE